MKELRNFMLFRTEFKGLALCAWLYAIAVIGWTAAVILFLNSKGGN